MTVYYQLCFLTYKLSIEICIEEENKKKDSMKNENKKN
jgi:hypothetical protein